MNTTTHYEVEADSSLPAVGGRRARYRAMFSDGQIRHFMSQAAAEDEAQYIPLEQSPVIIKVVTNAVETIVKQYVTPGRSLMPVSSYPYDDLYSRAMATRIASAATVPEKKKTHYEIEIDDWNDMTGNGVGVMRRRMQYRDGAGPIRRWESFAEADTIAKNSGHWKPHILECNEDGSIVRIVSTYTMFPAVQKDESGGFHYEIEIDDYNGTVSGLSGQRRRFSDGTGPYQKQAQQVALLLELREQLPSGLSLHPWLLVQRVARCRVWLFLLSQQVWD